MGQYQKTSDESSLSINTNLRSTVQVYRFFPSSINFQCMFLLVYTVYYQKQPPEQCSIKKFRKFCRKTPVLDFLFNKVAGLTPILKNICQLLLLHCTRTTKCYLPVLLYIQHFFLIITATAINIPDVCFQFKFACRCS